MEALAPEQSVNGQIDYRVMAGSYAVKVNYENEVQHVQEYLVERMQ